MCVVDIAERLICKYTYMCSYQLLQVIFWPDNIVGLFKRFGVKKNFDFLSEDSDSYDFFMLETILEAGYTPRVIIAEYNANFETSEAR